ncbi:MAG: hypothetical protein AB7F64_04525 [Gammaproteobacteria bacterium]
MNSLNLIFREIMLSARHPLHFLRFKPVFPNHVDFEKHERYLRYKTHSFKIKLSNVFNEQSKYLKEENQYIFDTLAKKNISGEVTAEELIEQELAQFQIVYAEMLNQHFSVAIQNANRALQSALNEFYNRVNQINFLLTIYVCGRKLNEEEENTLGIKDTGDLKRFTKEEKLAALRKIMKQCDDEVARLHQVIEQYV